MRYRWPEESQFTEVVLTVEQEVCSVCQRHLHICDHRFHSILSLQGPLRLVCKLAHCPDSSCPAHRHTLSPLAESQLTLPYWLIGWDVFSWLGFHRFSQHLSIPVLQTLLHKTHHIRLSEDSIAGYLQRYRCMVAARHQDAAVLAEHYKDIDKLVLTIDGLQPEKVHETLYVVRELRGKRVWFAEALLSSSAEEVRRLIAKAKDWATQLGKPVELWMSDKQDAFLKGIALEFPEVPHRYCQNHFLRDLAKPMLDQDSHAKVAMRKKVRGLRDIEKQILQDRQLAAAASAAARGATTVSEIAVTSSNVEVSDESVDSRSAAGATAALETAGVGEAADTTQAASETTAVPESKADTPLATSETTDVPGSEPDEEVDKAGQVVLDYCAVVRGILNDDQGGPKHPTGIRMAEALQEVSGSLQKNLDAKKGGRTEKLLEKLQGHIDRGLQAVAEEQKKIKEYVEEVKRVEATLDPSKGDSKKRKKRYNKLKRRLKKSRDPVLMKMAVVMVGFSAGLFAGPEVDQEIRDNLDLERWFRLPKSHERHIHGRKHAGVRLVQEGATLMPALDAHKDRKEPFKAGELLGYKDAKPPKQEREAMHRRKIMRRARSKKQRPILLAELERRYLEAP
jgi:hypothetical protein